jgi:NADH-quinone oxidoreductase subunit N
MTLAMVSLAGIPPLAGFFGKFLLLKAVIEQGVSFSAYYWLAGIAVVGVVASLYYYFGVIRTMYWSENVTDLSPIPISFGAKIALVICMAGILFIGVYPQPLLNLATAATEPLNALNAPGNAVARR